MDRIVIEETIAIVQEKYNGDYSLADIVEFLFESNVADYRRCQIACARASYFEKMKEPNKRVKDAKKEVAQKYHTSESNVENYIYTFKNIDFDTDRRQQ